MKMTWIVTCRRNGFVYTVFVNGTEDRLREYLDSELPEAFTYSGATEKEIEAAHVLRLPIYLY